MIYVVLFFRHVLCLTLEFFFVVFTIYLTRLISLSIIIFFGKYCYLYYLGDSWA